MNSPPFLFLIECKWERSGDEQKNIDIGTQCMQILLETDTRKMKEKGVNYLIMFIFNFPFP